MCYFYNCLTKFTLLSKSLNKIHIIFVICWWNKWFYTIFQKNCRIFLRFFNKIHIFFTNIWQNCWLCLWKIDKINFFSNYLSKFVMFMIFFAPWTIKVTREQTGILVLKMKNILEFWYITGTQLPLIRS